VRRQVRRAILEVAEEISADIIAVGTRGFSALGVLTLGNMAYTVPHASNRPVLVVL